MFMSHVISLHKTINKQGEEIRTIMTGNAKLQNVVQIQKSSSHQLNRITWKASKKTEKSQKQNFVLQLGARYGKCFGI